MAQPTYSELARENAELARKNAELVRENAELRRRCERYERRIQELEDEVRKLRQLLEEATRAAKRQAAPFSKGQPKSNPKKPGRKAGADYGQACHREPPRPDQIDEVHEARLPESCEDCGGPIEFIEVKTQYQAEIHRRPTYRQFNVHIGRCCDCGRRVQGRHPLQTSDALGAAASQLGPQLQGAIVELNKGVGAPYGKIRRVLKSIFNIEVSAGGCAQAVLRAARRLAPVQEIIKQAVAQQPCVSVDETGWRVGGQKAWLHVVASEGVVCYLVDPHRDASAVRSVIGPGYEGDLVHDGWAPYAQFTQAKHQQCLSHLLRRCNAMLEVATRGAVRLPRAVKRLLQDALRLRDRRDAGTISEHGLRVAVGRLRSRLNRLLRGRRSNDANRRLADHLAKHRDELFTFLLEPGVDATNWRAEQALRPAVVNRKVWGGNRTWTGAAAQSVLTSVLQTCHLHGWDGVDFISRILCVLRRPLPALQPRGP